jgi:hypothetical protein
MLRRLYKELDPHSQQYTLFYPHILLTAASQLLIAFIAEKLRDSDVWDIPVVSFWCYLRCPWIYIAQNRNNLPQDAQNALPSIERLITDVANLAVNRKT